MNKQVIEARKAFEQELKRVTGKPPHVLTERLIDLIKEIHLELNRN
jgi:hypothetical protein